MKPITLVIYIVQQVFKKLEIPVMKQVNTEVLRVIFAI